MDVKKLRDWYPAANKKSLFGYIVGAAKPKEIQTSDIIGRRGELVIAQHAAYDLEELDKPGAKQAFLATLKEVPPSPSEAVQPAPQPPAL